MSRGPLIASDVWLAGLQTAVQSETLGDLKPAPLPAALQVWLAELCLLRNVPFVYLVPDERMLPPESVRFFYVDRNWLDRLVDGALAAGAIGTVDQDLARDVIAHVRKTVDDASGIGANAVTGMLLRSVVVRRWPRMEVRATKHNQAVTALRHVRLADNILLVLWRGVPDKLELVEPQEGTQYGVDANSENNLQGAKVKVRADDGSLSGVEVNAPMRGAHPRVLNVLELARNIAGKHSDGQADAPRVALSLQQTPFTQVFEGAGSDHGGASLLVAPWSAQVLAETMTVSERLDLVLREKD
jgi:hypothetical protein